MLKTQQLTMQVYCSLRRPIFHYLCGFMIINSHQEYKQLKLKSTKRSSLVRQLRLFLDAEGYIHCGGRISTQCTTE